MQFMKGTGKEGQKHGPHEKMEEAPMESLREGWHKKGEPHIWMEGGKIPKRIPRLKVRSLEEEEQFEIDSFGIPVGGGERPHAYIYIYIYDVDMICIDTCKYV